MLRLSSGYLKHSKRSSSCVSLQSIMFLHRIQVRGTKLRIQDRRTQHWTSVKSAQPFVSCLWDTIQLIAQNGLNLVDFANGVRDVEFWTKWTDFEGSVSFLEKWNWIKKMFSCWFTNEGRFFLLWCDWGMAYKITSVSGSAHLAPGISKHR